MKTIYDNNGKAKYSVSDDGTIYDAGSFTAVGKQHKDGSVTDSSWSAAGRIHRDKSFSDALGKTKGRAWDSSFTDDKGKNKYHW